MLTEMSTVSNSSQVPEDDFGTQLTLKASRARAKAKLSKSLSRAHERAVALRAALSDIFAKDATHEDKMRTEDDEVNEFEDRIAAAETGLGGLGGQEIPIEVLEERTKSLDRHTQAQTKRYDRYADWRQRINELHDFDTSISEIRDVLEKARRALGDAGSEGLTLIEDHHDAKKYLDKLENKIRTWEEERQATDADMTHATSECRQQLARIEKSCDALDQIPPPHAWSSWGGSYPYKPPRRWANILLSGD